MRASWRSTDVPFCCSNATLGKQGNELAQFGHVHAGIHYPAGSLKSALCVRANRSLYESCAAQEVPFAAMSKYIVAVSARGAGAGGDCRARADERSRRACAVQPGRAARREDSCSRGGGVAFATTGIVDVAALLHSLYRACGGVDVVFRREIVAIERERDGGSGGA